MTTPDVFPRVKYVGVGEMKLRWENRPANRAAIRETGMEMPCFPASDLLWVQITQSYPNRLRFWILPSPESPELDYSCLLKSTFTQASHDRGFKTCQTPATYPECIFCGRKYRWGVVYVECHMDPNISKATTGKERVVTTCENHNQHRVS